MTSRAYPMGTSNQSEIEAEVSALRRKRAEIERRLEELTGERPDGEPAPALRDMSHPDEQRERLLSTMLASTRDFAYILDRDGRFVFANQSFLDLWGIPLDAAVGRSPADLGYPPELAARLDRQVLEVFETGHSIVDETPFTNAEGVEGFFEYIFTPVAGAAGEVEFVAGSTRDVTERKRWENELRASNENFHLLADNIADVFWIRSPDMKHVHYVSPAFEAIWGRPVATLYGEPLRWSDYILEEDRARVVTEFSDLTRNLSTVDVEYRITRPDGEVRWVRSRGVPVKDREGKVIRNIGIVTDTTDRKRAELALRESQERLRGIIDGLGPSMFVGLMTVDGVLIEINRAPLEAAGLAAEEVLGKHFADTFWWAHSVEAREQLRKAITRAARGEGSRYDVRVQGREGSLIDIDFSIEPLRDESGHVVFLIPSASVITKRKLAEEALRQAQKMEAVGQLAAGVAHEFNNLMQALMSMSAVIRRSTDASESAKVGMEMEFLLKRGAGLTQQLLLFSRHTPIKKEDLDVGEELRKASVLLRHLMPETIRIVVEVQSEPLLISGDRGQIHQVVLNLAINARDAMPAGGTLTLRAGHRGDEIFLEVDDTGHGIDAATHDRLFEPFFTTKEQGKGTGLGLPVAAGIVERHDGRFEVRTAPGEGSCFRVIFPSVTGGTPRTAEPASEQQVSPDGARLLLVEDDPSVRAGLEALLAMFGHEVTAAGSAEEALALTLDPPPALLLSDISLPGIAGPELAEQLRARWPALKVVLMSGYLDESMQRSAIRDQWRFLQKPFDLDVLEQELQQALAETV